MISSLRRLGRAAIALSNKLLGRGKVTVHTSENDNATPEKATVYTNPHTGQRYVKSNELIRTKKAKRQMDALRKRFGRKLEGGA